MPYLFFKTNKIRIQNTRDTHLLGVIRTLHSRNRRHDLLRSYKEHDRNLDSLENSSLLRMHRHNTLRLTPTDTAAKWERMLNPRARDLVYQLFPRETVTRQDGGNLNSWCLFSFFWDKYKKRKTRFSIWKKLLKRIFGKISFGAKKWYHCNKGEFML